MQDIENPMCARTGGSCGALLRQLQYIWDEIGESEVDKNRMLLEIEKEILDVYRRKVDDANNMKSKLHQSVAAAEAELATLMASLGELSLHSQVDKRQISLKEQLTSVTPLLDNLRQKKEERVKQFADVKIQIDKISGEISGYNHKNDNATSSTSIECHDLSLRKLNEYQTQLRSLQKEKSDRLHKVLQLVNEVHKLCEVLGLEFGKTVTEVHPSLKETDPGLSTNISDETLDGLSQAICKLKLEKKGRFQKLQEISASLLDLWNLMDSSEEERSRFGTITDILLSPEQNITCSGVLSLEIIEQMEIEAGRLTKLKASRMKELVLKKRAELEEICRQAHIEPDTSTAPDKSNALIDSGILDPSELLLNIEAQIVKAKEEAGSRKEIMDRIDKWICAREEEDWLEEYDLDTNKYSAGRGVHLNLKRAEKARITVNRIPGLVENLMNRALAWEEERHIPFLYDGVRLLSLLEDYKQRRRQREEEKKRFRDQKKLQDLLQAEKEAMYGSKPNPRRTNSVKKPNGYRANGNGTMTPMPRRFSAGSATPELLTPRSYSGRQNGYFKETRKMSTAPLNFVAISKEDISFASLCGSEPGSPLFHG